MRKILIVVDMQKDFVDGSLGTAEAQSIIPAAVKKIKDFDGDIFVTFDTHYGNYLNTAEGSMLPVVHCVKGTPGWELNNDIAKALENKRYTAVEKNTFGAADLPKLIGDRDKSIELIGLCTDICVISNALLLKAHYPECEISVDTHCCAGVTPQKHMAALDVMSSCQIVLK